MNDDNIQRDGDQQGHPENATTRTQGRQIHREAVIWAYRLFLDREPESDAIVDRILSSTRDSKQLRSQFLTSDEFLSTNADSLRLLLAKTIGRHSRRPVVERIMDRSALLAFFEHVKTTWTALGDTEPHWSVLSAEEFKQSNLGENLENFRHSGHQEVDQLSSLLANKGVALPDGAVCIEYGCGVGRVTRWLAEKFSQVIACDISAPHLALARDYLEREGRNNVQLKSIEGPEDIENLPSCDFFYSVIVLQHNPPPIIEFVIKNLADRLNPGGYGFFQVPTFSEGYSFSVGEYLSKVTDPQFQREMEMHVLPKDLIFGLIFEAGCVPIEVMEDRWAGADHQSFTFLIKKVRTSTA